MGLVALVQLTQRLLDHSLENSQDDQLASSSKSHPPPSLQQNSTDDSFVPSSQNSAQETGIFQVARVSLFSAAADSLISKSLAPQPATSPATPPANSAAANLANSLTSALASTPAAAQDSQTQIANLNASLAALNLSPQEITVIDRVAQLIKDFNPAAFTDLINQLQSLAAAVAPQATPTTQPVAATASAPDTTPQNANFTLQSLSIQFTEIDVARQSANPNSAPGHATTQFSAFQLQIQAVTLILNNTSTGAPIQIQAPQSATTATSSTSPLRAAAAAA
ncbi:MAG TPA: hypothetical protein VLC94_10240 [Candidatus Acidoferrum sp.]|nr:hypothetical protein [Candidatus Acidoferrum sp.]